MKRDEIALLLPEIFRRTLQPSGAKSQASVLRALLGVMQRLHDPDEKILETLDQYFDPYRVPAAKAADFLPFLARWVDLDWLVTGDLSCEIHPDCLRNLIMDAPHLASLRGTRRGLVLFLETATGITGFEVTEDLKDTHRPFAIQIICPYKAKPYRALIERIAASEKPAYIKYRLKFSPPDQPARDDRAGPAVTGGTS
jgi:phage tail-like protein